MLLRGLRCLRGAARRRCGCIFILQLHTRAASQAHPPPRGVHLDTAADDRGSEALWKDGGLRTVSRRCGGGVLPQRLFGLRVARSGGRLPIRHAQGDQGQVDLLLCAPRFSRRTRQVCARAVAPQHTAWRTPLAAVRAVVSGAPIDRRLVPHSHTPRWVNILFPGREAGAALSRSDFTSRLCAAPFEMPMGPRGNIVAGEDVLAPETLDSFWAYLAEGSETITLQTMVQRLQDMSPDENRDGAIGEGPDALDWKAFAKGLGVSPFEKW